MDNVKKYLLYAFLLGLLLIPLCVLIDTLSTAMSVIVLSTYMILFKAIMHDKIDFHPIIFDDDIIYDHYNILHALFDWNSDFNMIPHF